MKLLSIEYLKAGAMIELLAPWPGGSSVGQRVHDNGNLLHRTSDGEDTPDRRYWTQYDHFMSEYEARVQRAAYFRALIVRGWRKLAAALGRAARRLTARPQTAG